MKKVIVFSLLFCLLVSSAFAQFYIGGYGTSWWVPYRLTIMNEDESKRGTDILSGKMHHSTAVQVPWGEADIAGGIYAGGGTDWGGLSLGISLAGGKSNMPDAWGSATGSAVVWAKPFKGVESMETLTINLGTPNNDRLQGKIGSSNLALYVLNNSYRIQGFRLDYGDSQNNIFARLNPYNWGNGNRPDENLYWPRVAAGSLVTFEPIENLFIGMFVATEQWNLSEGSQSWGHLGNQGSGAYSYPRLDPANGSSIDGRDGAGLDQDFYDARKVYQKAQVAVGYNFDFGLARIQYIGMRNVIEAAFQLTSIENMMFDFGFKFPFEGRDKDEFHFYKKKRDYQVSAAMMYDGDKFNIMARVDTAFGGTDASNTIYPGQVMTRGLNAIAYVVPSFKLDEETTIGMDIGFEFEQSDLRNEFKDINGNEMDQMKMGVGFWLSRNLGHIQFKTAAVARLPLAYGGEYDNGLPLHWTGGKQSFDIFFPLMISAGF